MLLCLNKKEIKYTMKSILNIFVLLFGFYAFSQPAVDEGMAFDSGNSSYSLVPDTNYINTATSLSNRTIELSFKADATTARQVLFEEGAQVNAMIIYIEAGFLVVGAYRNNGDAVNEAIFFRKLISANTWYHVALVLDSGSSLKWYLNGTLEATDNSAFSIPKHTGDVNLGRSEGNLRYPNCSTWTSNKCDDNTAEDASNNFFTGLIWGFRIWNSARTQPQISTNKNSLITDETNTDLAAYMPDTYDEISYRNNAGNFVSASATNTTATLSIKEFNYLAKEVNVFSNEKMLYINSNLDVDIERVRIYSYQGREILSTNFKNEIDVVSINTGIYFVLFKLENGVVFSKKILLL